ncbi:DUF4142 domain-containing protein [Streptomyces agglomeratus]|uniref:DUF4142 domain-containing protein n=1 Tax=Streptomyces agglomeratus TaxID=285458 RepID=UPI000AD512DF|nr:DUF4142 domain-containing protein [Streptomyces agglomeratus]
MKHVGAVLVRDHTKLDADVKTLAGRLNVTLPASPSAEQKKELAAVQAKDGSSAYDAAWLTTQDAAHRKTLALIDHESPADLTPCPSQCRRALTEASCPGRPATAA